MFNKNENKGILRNIELFNEIVNEIVVIDSSDPVEFDGLKENISKSVKIYRALPLGHLEPLLAFGIKKVKSDFIIKLDADDIPSKNFIEEVKKKEFREGCYSLLTKELPNGIEHYRPGCIFSKDAISEITGIIHFGIKFKTPMKPFSKKSHVSHPPKEGINPSYLEIESYERPFPIFIEMIKERRKTFGEIIRILSNFPKMEKNLFFFGWDWREYTWKNTKHRKMENLNLIL
ncbi:MAG: hypothetical protein H5T45_04370 [Thermoplasmatales archaeon]|nr:hypothetical protein [Thermoplasmatales archaeon]